jgi:hypothetical protein
MSQVRFEPTIPVFEGAKTVQALDRAVTVIGIRHSKVGEIYRNQGKKFHGYALSQLLPFPSYVLPCRLPILFTLTLEVIIT